MTRKASDKQCALIKSLLEQIRAIDPDKADDVRADMLARIRTATDGVREASRIIDDLFALVRLVKANAPEVDSAPKFDAGFYEHADGRVVKIQEAKHGSGNLYAKLLNADSGKFEYASGLIRRLDGFVPLTKDRAAEYGHLYGMCMICGRTLTDEASIEAGIGPICASKF